VQARAAVRALRVWAPCRRKPARQQTGIARLLALFRHTGAALLVVSQLAEAREVIQLTRQGAGQLAGEQGRGVAAPVLGPHRESR